MFTYRPGYYFTFDNVADQFYSEWSPGRETEITKSQSGAWNHQLNHFKEWLSFLRREVESPDLWAAIADETEIIDAASSDESNLPFTPEETDYILSGLDEIKQYLLTAHRLDPELVEARLGLPRCGGRTCRPKRLDQSASFCVGWHRNTSGIAARCDPRIVPFRGVSS